MFNFPKGLSVETLEHFLQRSHHQKWLLRTFSAGVIAVFVYFLGGPIAGGLGVLWFAGASIAEFLYHKERLNYLAILAGSNQDRRDEITRKLFINTPIVAAIYTLPVLGLLFTGQSGQLLGLILATSILMNVSAQHVIHPRLIVFSLPVPALAFLLAAFALTDSHPQIVAIVATAYVIQVAYLTQTATLAYQELMNAISKAEAAGVARGIAESANETKSNFLANMSHELRTPLNAVIGYGEMLKESAEFEARQHDVKDIDKVLVSAKRLLHIVGEILDTSKISADQMTIERTSFDVKAELQTAMDMVGPSVGTNANQLTANLSDSLGVAVSDPLRFGQCVTNLLTNALKFTSQGEVTLSAERVEGPKGAMIEVTVQDNGIGIAADQHETIFQPFSQADASTTRQYGGTGLGLSLTRSLARLMGGDVTMTSEVGKGSCFVLTIAAEVP